MEWLIVAGTAGFTLALVPQVVRTLRRGRAQDISIPFALLVIGASFVTLVYWILRAEPFWVWTGFAANIVAWGLVLWYRVYPRPGTVPSKRPATGARDASAADGETKR